ncbi:phage tail tape measure protein [Cypionkella psychrotolerans]|uniref:phage tail tape measure protein n=1 Tax=Cypionkella psychrotolerans TaxID=1678131 RepID=UPI0006B483F5|nr:phage tail tape measure protein [Cypionkella psychrotolerans]
MDMTAAMELRVKNDQAKAALAATKADLKGVGDAAKGASVEGAKVGPALAGGAAKATPAVAGLENKLEELKTELGSVVAAEKTAVAQTAALAAQTASLDAHVTASGGKMSAGAYQAKLMAQQLSQVGQQTMATGQFVQALAIQLPDIGIGFGAVGGAVGLLAGIALPLLVSALGGAEEKALTLDEAVDKLGGSLDAYKGFAQTAATSTDELRTKFGEYASDVKGFAEFMKGVTLSKSLDDMKLAIDPLKGGLSEVAEKLAVVDSRKKALSLVDPSDVERIARFNEQIARSQAEAEKAAAKYGVSADQARQLIDALDGLGNVDGGNMTGLRDAAASALGIMQQMVPVGSELPAPLRDAASALNEIVEKTAEATAVTSEHVSMVDDLSAVLYAAMENAGLLASSGPQAGWLSGAISDATTLAAKLWDAAAAAAAADGLDAAGNPTEFGKGSAGRRPPRRAPHGIGGVDWGAPPATRTGGGASGGAAKIDPDSFAALTKSAEDALEKLENAVAGIHEKVRLGLMSTAEGTKAIASAKDQAANSIADLIPKLEKVADAAGPKAAAAVGKWRAEVKGLVGDLNEASAGLADKLSSNFEKGFADFLSGAKKGKAAMADFKNFVIQKLAEIAAQKFTASIITPFLDSLIGGITGGLSGGTSGGTGSMGLPQPFALGGVPGGPGIKAYSGTVVSKPTFFPMAKGAVVGLMGEAGDEAVMPLARDASGRLGVRASGGGGGDVIVNITTPPGTKATSTERSQGGDRIMDVVIEMVGNALAGDITQGRGAMSDAMTNTFGLSRVGR